MNLDMIFENSSRIELNQKRLVLISMILKNKGLDRKNTILAYYPNSTINIP